MSPNILGLDIGSSTICASLFVSAGEDLILKGIGTTASSGIVKGKIQSMELVQKAIDKAIQKAELLAQCRAHHVVLTLPCYEQGSVYSSGILSNSKKMGKIKPAEKLECVKRSQLKLPLHEATILHTLPLQFKVDGSAVLNPVGIEGVQLEVLTHTILGSTATINTLKQWLNHRHLTVRAFVSDTLGHAELALTPTEYQNGAILVDIGGRYTKVSLFEKNVLQNITLIPIAGDSISADISYGLKLSLQDADKAKTFYTGIPSPNIDQSEFVELACAIQGTRQIPTQYLHRIMEARLEELFKFVSKAIQKHPQAASFPLVLCGRSSQIKGIERYAENIHPKVRLGHTSPDADYSCASGLVQYHKRLKFLVETQKKQDPLSRFNRWVKEFF